MIELTYHDNVPTINILSPSWSGLRQSDFRQVRYVRRIFPFSSLCGTIMGPLVFSGISYFTRETIITASTETLTLSLCGFGMLLTISTNLKPFGSRMMIRERNKNKEGNFLSPFPNLKSQSEIIQLFRGSQKFKSEKKDNNFDS
jgi:hypothetical protein